MREYSIFEGVIPVPREIFKHDGKLSVQNIKRISAPSELEKSADEIIAAFRFFGITLDFAAEGQIRLELDNSMKNDAFTLMIKSDGIIIRGSISGVFYGAGALRQLLGIALMRGKTGAVIACGEIVDEPLFTWRAFMLDSARHFQSKEKIKQIIRWMAFARLNVLHWHLTDNQGWRIKSDLVPELSGLCTIQEGQYSVEDLQEIASYAAEYFIDIVPEVDMPGHSRGLLKHYPQYACDPDNPGSEYCLSNPEVKTFLKSILTEVMNIFPSSKIIHIGGDEASTAQWDKCPRCQSAMQNQKFHSIRQLENQFMAEMCRFVIDSGRRPMVWFTESVLPQDTIIQAWTSLHDMLKTVPHGNEIVNSVHTNYYFDYPENSDEEHEPWMLLLPEETVYMTEPYLHKDNKVKDLLLGVEACLWTEHVPEWRIRQKMMSRLAALAETAWSRPEDRSWPDFQRRRKQLEAASLDELP